MKKIDTRVVGMQHRTSRQFRNHLKSIRDVHTVMFDREPDNEYDRNAIRVLLKEMHIGYLPREIAALLSPRIDAGTHVLVKGFLSDVQPELGQAKVVVQLRKLLKAT